MTKVFIGGSRRLTRLNPEVRRRLDRIIEKGLAVVIGDAHGADKAVQRYLHAREYQNVEVFCTNGVCRNNLGNWRTRPVSASRGARGFEYYAAKDVRMAEEGSVGFMLWDGESKGTLANILRLVEQGKKAVLYIAPTKQFAILRTRTDYENLLSLRSKKDKRKLGMWARSPDPQSGLPREAGLF